MTPSPPADAAGLYYAGIYHRGTLTVHSSLEAVGLLAAITRALADARIACNAVSGFYHHLFVPAARATAVALAVLAAVRCEVVAQTPGTPVDAPPAAARALALPGVRWVRRLTRHADIYVLAGSAAESALDRLPDAVERAIAADLAWLGSAAGAERMQFFFVGTREQMRPLVGWTPGGYAEVGERTAFFVANEETRPALRHEIMHLLSWRLWGTPGGIWLSEGVATRAAGGCGGFAVDDVAAVLARENALPTLDALRSRFDVRGRTGAVQYLASASLVGYVDRAYGRPALRRLWTTGLRGVHAALGVSAEALERGWRGDLARRRAPAVSWATLWTAIEARGCE